MLSGLYFSFSWKKVFFWNTLVKIRKVVFDVLPRDGLWNSGLDWASFVTIAILASIKLALTLLFQSSYWKEFVRLWIQSSSAWLCMGKNQELRPAHRLSFDDITFCNNRIIFKISLSPKFWKYHTMFILRHALWSAFNAPLKLRSHDSFHLVGHTSSMYWHTLCHFYAFDAFNIYIMCINHAYHAFCAIFL